MDNIPNSDFNIYREINEKIRSLNSIVNLLFGYDFFKPEPTLIAELFKPISSRLDLDLKLLQFGLLIDSIPKKEVDKLINNDNLSLELAKFYLKAGSKMVEDSSRVELYSKIFQIPSKQPVYIIESRKPNTIDSIEFLLNKRLTNFNVEIIGNLRLLRSCRNISSYAHNLDPKEIDKKLRKFGFRHPLMDNQIFEFWNRFLKVFSDTLSYLISELQSYRTDFENSKILIFRVKFNKSQIQFGDRNNIIFNFHNLTEQTVMINTYKIDAFFTNKLIRKGGWGKLGLKLKPNEEREYPWSEVDPTKYYGYNKKGKWRIDTNIEFKLEDEVYQRTIEDKCYLSIQ